MGPASRSSWKWTGRDIGSKLPLLVTAYSEHSCLSQPPKAARSGAMLLRHRFAAKDRLRAGPYGGMH